ncbi:MAG TPA: hypothetical protein VKB61_09465 [Candidatus Acidoferrum sp.]|nr:hypothetical protein [Candidatus Acidoferrum sp.]
MRQSLFLGGVLLLLLSGCQKHKQPDYSPLDQSGMWASSLDQLKKLNINDKEIAQLAKLKQSGASDDLCLALFKMAHDHQHEFNSADPAIELSRAGYADQQILAMAQSDQIDMLSGEAVTLKLMGLSNPTVQAIIDRRTRGLPTLTSEQIGRLKNTGLSEKQIVELINEGLTPEQAEAQVARREAARNHSNTGFVRVQGRRR